MTKLALQVQVISPASTNMLRETKPRALKVLQDGVPDRATLEYLIANGLRLVVGRHTFTESGDPGELEGRLSKLLSWADQNLRWMLSRGVRVVLEIPYNEELQNGEALDRLSDLTIKGMAIIANSGYDIGIGVFSEGNPSGQGHPDPFVDWVRFYPALKTARGFWRATKTRVFLCLHEYGIPALGVVDTWHNFRYRRVWERLPEDCKVPILITESGIDGGIEGQRAKGWRGYMDSRGYNDWLTTTRNELNKDPYVWFSFVFLSGCNNDWRLFDCGDEVDLRPAFTQGPPLAQWNPQKDTGGTGPSMDIKLAIPAREQHAAEGNYEATRPRTMGVVIHTTRGGASTIENEYIATCNWFQNPEAQVSAHLIIGDGKFPEVCRSVHDDEVAYHAREDNKTHLSIEIAQRKDGDPLSDFQYKAAAEACRLWSLKYGFPLKRVMTQTQPGIVGHEDTEAGRRDGKTDPGRAFDWTKFMALLGAVEIGGPPLFSIDQVRGQLWSLAELLEKNGHPWFGQAIKSIVALSKNEA